MRPLLFASIAFSSFASHAMAVILYSSPTRNTSEPTGSLSNSGWQYEGDFRGFLGTPIGPHHFVTAQHIGIQNQGDVFVLNGATYNTTYVHRLAGTDLAVVEVSETFANWAPMFNPAVDGSEVNRPMVVFGRGTQRGGEILATAGNGGSPLSRNADNSELRGWYWGDDDRVRSWGTNDVAAIVDGGNNYGDLIYSEFNSEVGGNESILSGGDSGGGVFINVAGVWKLAGVNFSVDGPFRFTETGPTFLGAVFDAGGLWYGDEDPQYLPDADADIAAGSYSSRIGSNLTAINAILGTGRASLVPEPTMIVWGGIAIAGLLRRRRA